MTSEEYQVKLAENSISFGEKLMLISIVAIFVYVPNLELNSSNFIEQVLATIAVLSMLASGTYLRTSGLNMLRELLDTKS